MITFITYIKALNGIIKAHFQCTQNNPEWHAPYQAASLDKTHSMGRILKVKCELTARRTENNICRRGCGVPLRILISPGR
jgi:hypothetical protein